MSDLELDDVQGLVARAYPDLTVASYLLLRIEDRTRVHAWLARMIEQVTPAPAHPADAALNLALTPSGLRALGLSDDTFDQFPYEYRTGMVTPHKSLVLGDIGPSAPEVWDWGGPGTPAVDLLLLLFAREAAMLEERYAAIASTYASGGVAEVTRLDSLENLHGREHFGFTDGISQPTIDGLSARRDIPPNTVAPGEFILGYRNEYGHYTDRPLLDSSADPRGLLPPDPEGSGRVDLGRNGTYLVFRHLSQDVRGFWQYVDRASREGGDGADEAGRVRLAAKMVGRWPSGAPLTLAPDADDPALATANDFTYHAADADGLACPIGAHVRRAHPRDSLDPDPGTVSSVALDKHHRLLRRGREYGPAVIDAFAPAPAGDPDRGLYFICLAANIARQFEFIQHTWLNDPKFDGLYDEPDPLVANHSAGGANFSVLGEQVRTRYTDLPTFVTVRGGGYFFLPGLRALRYLASLTPPS